MRFDICDLFLVEDPQTTNRSQRQCPISREYLNLCSSNAIHCNLCVRTCREIQSGQMVRSSYVFVISLDTDQIAAELMFDAMCQLISRNERRAISLRISR